jgi:hypothetical protein
MYFIVIFFFQLDAIDTSNLESGKLEALQHRKALNKEVDELLQQTQMLYHQLNAVIQSKVSEMAVQAVSAAPPAPPSSKEQSSAPLLSREETAKLLLLVSKASAGGYISSEQKG